MAGFMSAPLSGSQLANLGLSSSQTAGLVGSMSSTGVTSSQESLIAQSMNFSALGQNMSNMGMTPELKTSMSKWNTEFSKMSKKMQSLGINSSQTSSLTGITGLSGAPNIATTPSFQHIKNPHFNTRMTSTIGKMKKLGHK
jgi:hypothetical protein